MKCAYCGGPTYGDNFHCEDCLRDDDYDEDSLTDDYWEDPMENGKCTRCYVNESHEKRICPWSEREGSDDIVQCDCCDSCSQICKPTSKDI